jgi:hypothetical protein
MLSGVDHVKLLRIQRFKEAAVSDYFINKNFISLEIKLRTLNKEF